MTAGARRSRVDITWQQDQVIAIMREHGRPMNSTEVSRTLPYLDAIGCRWDTGTPCHQPEACVPMAGVYVHLHARDHTTSDHATEVLNLLLAAGVVTREKVDRRVMWALSPGYVTESRKTATLAASILARVKLSESAAELTEERW